MAKRYHWTLKQFQDSTCLLPHIIAERVADDRLLPEDQAQLFAVYVETHALDLFNRNRKFRLKLLNEHKALDYMYMFTEHWLDAAIKRGEYKPLEMEQA
jgi:hypothetical protein